MSRTALARRYRPRHFSEVATQEHVSQTLRAAVQRDRVAHAYLFCGPRGVGKAMLLSELRRELSRHQRLLDLAARTLGHVPSKIGLLEDQTLVRYVLWRRLFCGASWARISPEVKLPGPMRPRTIKDDLLAQVAESPLPEPPVPASAAERLATRYSFPNWLVNRLAELHPQEHAALEALGILFRAGKIDIRVEPRRR